MKFVAAQSGKLVELDSWQQQCARRISTGQPALDELYGSGGLVRAAVHELLHPPKSARPMYVAMILARAALGLKEPKPPALSFMPDLAELRTPQDEGQGVVILSDPRRELYPPAAVQLGIPLSRLYLLHPGNREQELWAISECLASPGVVAVVANLGKLSQVEARRLQLSAERGGGIGLFMRPANANVYAAATRLLVSPRPVSEGASQRWELRLLHGHGGQVGKSVVLEYNREEHTVRSSAELADHAGEKGKKAGVA